MQDSKSRCPKGANAGLGTRSKAANARLRNSTERFLSKSQKAQTFIQNKAQNHLNHFVTLSMLRITCFSLFSNCCYCSNSVPLYVLLVIVGHSNCGPSKRGLSKSWLRNSVIASISPKTMPSYRVVRALKQCPILSPQRFYWPWFNALEIIQSTAAFCLLSLVVWCLLAEKATV